MVWSRPSGRCLVLALCLAIPRAASALDPADSTASAVTAGTVPDSALRPTAAVPWNPARAIPAHEPWEAALDAPMTVASVPFRAAGALAHAGLLRIQEDNLVARIRLLAVQAPTVGIGVRPASLGDRTGFGGAVDLDPPPLHGWLRGGLDASTAGYHRGRIDAGPRVLHARYVYEWRPREPYFGPGSGRHEDASNYAVQTQRAELRLHWAAAPAASMRRSADVWVGERRSVLRRGRDPGRPGFETVFPGLATDALDDKQRHFITGARLVADTRAGHPHWATGWRLAWQVERYAPSPPDHGVLFRGDADSPAFLRYQYEAQAAWSFMRDPRTLRAALRITDVQPFEGEPAPAVYDLSTLGGSAGLAGYEPGRFHGLDAIVARVGWLYPLAEHAELELAVEAGTVAGDVWSEPRLDRLEHAYSVTFRPRTRTVPLGAVGLSWSRESVRFVFAIGGVE